MLTDFRAAWRALRRAPGFLAAAVLTLALGVGATTALFGVVDRVLLRPLPYRDADRLVRVWPARSVPDALYELLRDRDRASAALAAYTYPGDASVLAGDRPAREQAVGVTGSLFPTLGVAAAIGRTLGPADVAAGADPVAVVSDAFWRERLGADPRAVGRRVTVDGVPHTVVGVMPPRFALPTAAIALWTPARVDRSNVAAYWWTWRMNLVARLAPGVTPAQATARLRATAVAAGQTDFPMRMSPDYGRDLTAVPFQDAVVGGARTTLALLLGGVLVMLLVAVVNVTGLALVRAAGRAREVTVRAAVGATRARLVRQLTAEGVVVAGAAAVLGTAVAWAVTRLLVAALPRTGAGALPRAEEIGLDARALAAAVGVALVAGVASSLAPALAAARVDLRGALSDGGRGASGGGARRRGLEALVAAQIALGVILAAGAGLLATSLTRLSAVDPGFRPEQVTDAAVPPPARIPGTADSAHGARVHAFYDALLTRARAIPGVRETALAAMVPFDPAYRGGPMDLEAHPHVAGGTWNTVDQNTVTAGALHTLGIPLVAGRDFTAADRVAGAPVAMVDVAAVRAYWPEYADDVRRVIGQRIRRPNNGAAWETVVGVTGSVVRDSLSARPTPTLYRPVAQDFPTELRLVVRGTAGPADVAPALRRIVADLDPAVPVGSVRALTGLIADSAGRARFVALVLVAFALAAVGLAAVGVYGVVAFAVARRTREVGVRVAFGATPAAVRGLVLRDGGRLAVAGVAVGLTGALVAGRVARGLFYGLGAVEPVVLVGVTLLLGTVVLLATLVPARRAARVDPLVALRAD